MRLSDWPQDERPREKLLRRGAMALSDAELLAIFLRTGIAGTNVVDLARSLLQQFGSLQALFQASTSQFCQQKGLGEAKYVQLQAVLELARRYFDEQSGLQLQGFTSPGQVKDYLRRQLVPQQREVFAVMFLDSQHRLIAFEPLFFGTINAAAVYPRVIVQRALLLNASALILAHNHPSGVAEPSLPDRRLTEQVIDACRLMDIQVLDHIVVAGAGAVSFAERGWIAVA